MSITCLTELFIHSGSLTFDLTYTTWSTQQQDQWRSVNPYPSDTVTHFTETDWLAIVAWLVPCSHPSHHPWALPTSQVIMVNILWFHYRCLNIPLSLVLFVTNMHPYLTATTCHPSCLPTVHAYHSEHYHRGCSCKPNNVNKETKRFTSPKFDDENNYWG